MYRHSVHSLRLAPVLNVHIVTSRESPCCSDVFDLDYSSHPALV